MENHSIIREAKSGVSTMLAMAKQGGAGGASFWDMMPTHAFLAALRPGTDWGVAAISSDSFECESFV